MGAAHFSLNLGLVEFLQSKIPLTVFVETGTFKGEALKTVSGHFQSLYSVEFSQKLYENAQKAFSGNKNIHIFQGHSPDFIKLNRYRWKGCGTLYWLDAHWCDATDTAEGKAQCPLLNELDAIEKLPENSIILIDDARLFTAPPQGAHDLNQWPDFDSIIGKLKSLSSKHKISILNDVIVYLPVKIYHDFLIFAQQHNVDILTIFDKSKGYDAMLNLAKEKEAVIQEQARQLKEKEAVIQALANRTM